MNSPDSLDDAVLLVTQNPAPVVMFDTCSLLDILRFPQIGCHKHGNVLVAHRLVKSQIPRFHIMVTCTVLDEWERNAAKVKGETSALLARIDKQQEELFNAIKSLPDLMMASYPSSSAVTLGSLDIASKLKGLMQELLQSAICLPNEDDPLKKAYHRLLLSRAPAKKGGGGPDCAIIETYLAFVGKLREKKFAEKTFFLTSNKDDFCDGQKRIHQDLAGDFERLEIDFLPELLCLPLD